MMRFCYFIIFCFYFLFFVSLCRLILVYTVLISIRTLKKKTLRDKTSLLYPVKEIMMYFFLFSLKLNFKCVMFLKIESQLLRFLLTVVLYTYFESSKNGRNNKFEKTQQQRLNEKYCLAKKLSNNFYWFAYIGSFFYGFCRHFGFFVTKLGLCVLLFYFEFYSQEKVEL